MDTPQNKFSLSCEIQIIRAKNINLKSSGSLFVRSYLFAGNNSKIRLNTREISINSDLVWNQSTSLDCLGTQASLDKLVKGTIVFELRWRKNNLPIFGRGSQLLGRAEIPWKSVFESSNMEVEKWIVMIPKSWCVYDEDNKPTMLQISMKIRAPTVTEMQGGQSGKVAKWNECGCGDNVCKSCLDYDMFVLGAILEGFYNN